MHSKSISWQNPLNFAHKIACNYSQQFPNDSFVFLYSGLAEKKTTFSYLALFAKNKIITDDFILAKKIIKNSREKWFGFIAYEVAHQFENFNKTEANCFNENKIHFEQFHVVFKFNHRTKTINITYSSQYYLDLVLDCKAISSLKIPVITKNLFSNFSDAKYLEEIGNIKNKISNGDLFQLNLTRKFIGDIANKVNLEFAFSIFLNHHNLTKTNYSSLIKFGDLIIISSSPELFFEVRNRKIL